ncbi:MAG: outer membrane beta-barrel protein [Mariniphaga sp.]
MKKLLSVFLLLFLIASTNAQSKFKLTFLASPQVSWMKSDSKEISPDRSFLGFGYGIEGDFYLGNENYALTTGLTMSSAGGSLIYSPSINFDGKALPAGTKVEYFIKYVEVPLALKMRSKDFNRTRIFAQFGITNWLNVGTKAATSDLTFQKEGVKGEVKLYNIGLNVGAGLEYDLGHGNSLTGGLVYSNGLLDATSNSTISESTTLKVVRFRLGFVF